MNISNIKEKIDIYVNNNLTNIEQRKKFGEVFTPELLINKMLDLVSSDIWSNPNVKIGDFSVGVGNFTVFIIERFMNGLKDYISNDVDRYNYIIENIIYVGDLQERNIAYYKHLFGKNGHIYHGDFLSTDFDTQLKMWNVEFDYIIY